MEKILERCAALDVHKRQLTACARVPDRRGERAELRAEFETMTPDLLALRDWLKGLGVTHVAMEATGVYWKPVYYLLEDDFELLLVNAQHVKNVPGRKTDVADAQWLCQLLEHGLLRPSFVPPKPIRELHDLTRYRKSLIWERQREANRLQKLLEDANIKLASVATRTLGVSGRAMLAELCEGRNDPEALAELARGKLRKKIPELRRALEGRFSSHHALLASRLLAHIDYLDETIAELSAEIEERLRPFEREVELLLHDPGGRAAHGRGDPGRVRSRHEPVPHPSPRRELGRNLPRKRRVRRQAADRQDAQGRRLASHGAGRGRELGRGAHPRHLPERPIHPDQAPPGPQESDRRRRPLDPRQRLLHPSRWRALRGARRRLLHQP